MEMMKVQTGQAWERKTHAALGRQIDGGDLRKRQVEEQVVKGSQWKRLTRGIFVSCKVVCVQINTIYYKRE